MEKIDVSGIELYMQRYKNGAIVAATNTGKYIQHIHAQRIGNAVDIAFLQGKYEPEMQEAIIRRIFKGAPIQELYFSTGLRGIELGDAAHIAEAVHAAL